ncbi:MAG: hypothetical protein U0R17_04480 [Acidimicrobiia bacterium]
MEDFNEDKVVSDFLSKNKPKKDYIFWGLMDIRERSVIGLQVIVILLAIVEATQAVLNILHPGKNVSSHTYAHLGSYSLAYSAALFVVGMRPARARGLLIIFTVATVGFISTSVIDIFNSKAQLATEFQHITKLIPPFVVWLIATRVVFRSKSLSEKPS